MANMEIKMLSEIDLMKQMFSLIAGLGIFLIGMHLMSDGMKNAAGNRMSAIIGTLTKNRFTALIVGVLVTGLVQSSSVTTVMVIGFVNSTLMTLKQALGVILGANIGTTVTGWFIALKIGKYGAPLLFVGAIMYLFSKKEKRKTSGMIILGIGMIFYGLSQMKAGMSPLGDVKEFIDFFSVFNANTIFGAIKVAIVGALLTAVIQSSSATMGITITLVASGLISPVTGIALVLGENVGTTITAFLASLGASANARRAALAHTIVNIIGVTWVLVIFKYFYGVIFNIYNIDPNAFDPGKSEIVLATAHTSFNVTNALLFLPFLNQLTKLLKKLIPDGVVTEKHLAKLDVRMLETPAIALSVVKEEVVNVGNETIKMFDNFAEIISKNMTEKDQLVIDLIEKEDEIDLLQKEISDMSGLALTYDLTNDLVIEAKTSIIVADEYESISDYVTALTKLHLKLQDRKMDLEEKDVKDIVELNKVVKNYMQIVAKAYEDGNIDEKIVDLANMGAEINAKCKKLRGQHLDGYKTKKLDVYYTTTYIDMIKMYRRIKTHIFHITESIVMEGKIIS